MIEKLDTVELVNPRGMGPVVILCEHASNFIPDRYAGLGLSADAVISHAAWDPGARAVSLILSRALDAPMIAGRVSRLVYDCNRPPEAPSAMPERSEIHDIPGNQNLTNAQKEARIAAVYQPFCDTVSEMLDHRIANGVPTAVVTVHSFTPIYHGQSRTVELGLLHDTDSTLADAMLARTKILSHRRIERNQPYGPADGVTHSLKLHAISRALPNVMIEARNDLLKSESQIETIASEILNLLQPALAALGLVEMGSAHG